MVEISLRIGIEIQFKDCLLCLRSFRIFSISLHETGFNTKFSLEIFTYRSGSESVNGIISSRVEPMEQK